MTTDPGGTAVELCAAADEALAEAAFRTGKFGAAEQLFAGARAAAARDGDRLGEALAVGGLGMTFHYRNITALIDGRAPADADVAAEEELMRHALTICQETGDSAGTARALFGMGLVFQVLRRDWAAAMSYYWPAFGLAEALEECGDLYGRSEIHRHIGFYYLAADVRPREAVRQLALSLALRERLGDSRKIPSALVSLSAAEIAAENPERALELADRAVTMAREARLLPWRLRDAEQSLREAREAATSR